ncbi:MAG: hypothetical protein IT514_08570 [Burkholderiales bacterium]|nr:hypothetical protein [Burkholderiales bacterium]
MGLGKVTAQSQGAAEGYPFISVPHPVGMIPAEEVRRKADDAVQELLGTALHWQPRPRSPESPCEAGGLGFEGSVHELNRFFFEKGWSLGLPILPPTHEAVARMVRATKRETHAVIGQVPPRMGLLTVELAAAHAVMAGCRPEYMPVLIAALEAMLEPEVNWVGAATTTATTSAVVIVNGPVVKQIGIASRQGAAGADHHPNVSMGYAINLIADIVGGAKSPSPDKSTLGAPSDLVCWFFAENEDALPEGWQPLHVQRGFDRGDSVVTFMAAYPPADNADHWSATPEEHLEWWAHLVSPLTAVGGPCEVNQMDRHYLIGIGPEHAALVAGGGWSQDVFKRRFWERVRSPLSAWPRGGPHRDGLAERVGTLSPDTLSPVTMQPRQFLTVITGGAGKHSHYFAPFPRCSPASRKVGL